MQVNPTEALRNLDRAIASQEVTCAELSRQSASAEKKYRELVAQRAQLAAAQQGVAV